ncbi:MAG: hypothetical protein BGO69_16515 [Bacteroidetes bacterium 46-16]|nr:MAG: hypothetical protein BGO69_16515 [Bacteroidetes bacterium 46-16]
MEKFITGDIWKQANKIVKENENKIACIAYVTFANLSLSNGDTLICDVSDYAIKYKQTSAQTLQNYYKKGVKIYSNSQLHAKLLLTNSVLILGSANLSKSSANYLTEAAIITQNDSVISQARSFCYNLQNEALPLNKRDIERLLKLPTIETPQKPKKVSGIRRKRFGSNYWFISVFPLSDKLYNKISGYVEPKIEEVSKQENIETHGISFIRWRANTPFAHNIKEGDQIIMRFHNKNKTQSHIYPPVTILKKETRGGFIYLYHRDNTENRIAWSSFATTFKKTNNKKSIGVRRRMLSSEDVQSFKKVWDVI